MTNRAAVRGEEVPPAVRELIRPAGVRQPPGGQTGLHRVGGLERGAPSVPGGAGTCLCRRAGG